MFIVSRASTLSDITAPNFAGNLQIVGTTTVGGMFYGFMTATAGVCAHTLIQTQHRQTRRRLWFLLAYIAAMWIAGTVEIGGTSWVMFERFVGNNANPRADPYAQTPTTGVSTTVTDTAGWLVTVLSDGLMLWRFKVLWKNSRWYRYLMVPPIALYTANLVVGAFVGLVFNLGGQSIWSGTHTSTQRTFTAFWMLSLSLNLYVTLLIAGRLFLYRRRFIRNIGSPHAGHYTSIGCMFIESYAALALFTVVFSVTYVLDNPAQYMTCAMLVQMEIIAPLMAMIRILRGVAWDSAAMAMSESAVEKALGALSDT